MTSKSSVKPILNSGELLVKYHRRLGKQRDPTELANLLPVYVVWHEIDPASGKTREITLFFECESPKSSRFERWFRLREYPFCYLCPGQLRLWSMTLEEIRRAQTFEWMSYLVNKHYDNLVARMWRPGGALCQRNFEKIQTLLHDNP